MFLHVLDRHISISTVFSNQNKKKQEKELKQIEGELEREQRKQALEEAGEELRQAWDTMSAGEKAKTVEILGGVAGALKFLREGKETGD